MQAGVVVLIRKTNKDYTGKVLATGHCFDYFDNFPENNQSSPQKACAIARAWKKYIRDEVWDSDLYDIMIQPRIFDKIVHDLVYKGFKIEYIYIGYDAYGNIVKLDTVEK